MCFLGEEGKAEPLLGLFIFNCNMSKVEADSLLLELICLWCFSLTNRAGDKLLIARLKLSQPSVDLLANIVPQELGHDL